MSSIGNTSYTPTPTEITLQECNRYITDNPADHIESERLKSKIYKVAAVASMIFLGVAIVGGIVSLVHFYPVAVPFFLIIGGGTYKLFYTKVFKVLKQKSDFAMENSLAYEGMAKAIAKVEGVCTNYATFGHQLKDLGIEAHKIPMPHSDFSPLSKLIGRVTFWQDTEVKLTEEIQAIDEEIEAINREIDDNSGDPKHNVEKTRLKMERQRVKEQQLFPAKIAGAYALHVLAHITDTRDVDEFGTCTPSSYISMLEYENEGRLQPYFFFPEDSSKRPLSTRDIQDKTQLELSKEIFGDRIALIG